MLQEDVVKDPGEQDIQQGTMPPDLIKSDDVIDGQEQAQIQENQTKEK